MNLSRIAVVSLSALMLATAARAETPDLSSCDRASFHVLLDVGHTAEAPGALSARGVPEFLFNFRLAKEIEQALNDAGFGKTEMLVMTGAAKPAMYQRVAQIKGASADLLLSIHHDAVPGSFLQRWEYEDKPLTYSDRFRGHSIFVANGNGEPKASLEFAKLLGGALKERGLHYAPHYTEAFMGRFRRELLDKDVGVYRYDTLFILNSPRIPAVLFEAGSIVNRTEELMLGIEEYRAVISAAVTGAVESFCAAQGLRVAHKLPHKLASVPRVRRQAPAPSRTAAAE